MTVYGLYKGDKFIDVGTAEEIAKRQDIEPETVRYLAYSTRVKLAEEKNKKSLIAVVVEKIRKVPTDELAKKQYMRERRRERYIKKQYEKEI